MVFMMIGQMNMTLRPHSLLMTKLMNASYRDIAYFKECVLILPIPLYILQTLAQLRMSSTQICLNFVRYNC
ncbi:hypothetical protein Bca4012_092777 [Brassica carinata]|uniref:Uncharacterized protein n=1 Tax=Brassica carinata TaxID=52824 RepID=A0A8X7PRD3_BRACI|nr:hypothetical protein Bca52824_075072 [Brassica carinata]